MSWKTLFSIVVDTFYRSQADNVAMLAAGLAFYSLISLAPLLVIAISVAGLAFGQEAARGEVMAQLAGLMGKEGAAAVQEMVRRTSEPTASISASIIGLVVLLFGASRLFGALELSLNAVWRVQLPAAPGFVANLVAFLKYRFLSFLMVLGTGFLLTVSLLVTAALAAINKYFQSLLPGWELMWFWVSAIVNFGVTTFIFGAILRGVPDVVLRWRDVMVGAVVTSIFFSVGRLLIGMYLGQGSFASVYGAAGSLVILLFWLYYSAQILLFGAEFTKVFAERRGVPIQTRMGAQVLE